MDDGCPVKAWYYYPLPLWYCGSSKFYPSVSVEVWNPCESVLPRSVSHQSKIPISHTPNDLKYAAQFFLQPNATAPQQQTNKQTNSQHSEHAIETFSHVRAYPSPHCFLALLNSNKSFCDVRLYFKFQNSRASMFEFCQTSAEIFLCIQYLSGWEDQPEK